MGDRTPNWRASPLPPPLAAPALHLRGRAPASRLGSASSRFGVALDPEGRDGACRASRRRFVVRAPPLRAPSPCVWKLFAGWQRWPRRAMEPRLVKPPGQDLVVERLKSRYGLGGSHFAEVRPRPSPRPVPVSAGRFLQVWSSPPGSCAQSLGAGVRRALGRGATLWASSRSAGNRVSER